MISNDIMWDTQGHCLRVHSSPPQVFISEERRLANRKSLAEGGGSFNSVFIFISAHVLVLARLSVDLYHSNSFRNVIDFVTCDTNGEELPPPELLP